ncbi:dihydroorotase, multifunctional complex type [Sulfuricella denitrificans skB26]|uniref:Dihydroorotase, multifunctional complex type n=1 Tax=Sulfuricella denitrificans (strain DSM 22764 / NBRC 105220 / skB26) TaxID=1163617 RepID=S6AAT7_SULDS|nr:dihydroorotase [Sulfuricella denitrificans]BAN34058.1 dihydroorotase, multifunctional complex type [Sulfuricella denitrificans skB26]
MKIHIKNGRLIDPNNNIDAQQDVFIAAGKIVAVGAMPERFNANRTIDAAGLVVCPGLVDLSARLREPGLEYKATLESEMLAAVAGGVTSLVCPPDTDPPLDEPGLVEMLKHRAKSLNQARVYPLGALTQKLGGERLTEMAELHDAGCIAFSHADVPLADTNVLLHAMQYAATFGFTVWLRPQDAFLARDGVAHDGEVATRLGLASIPSCAETIALASILTLARETGARIHICRLSSREGVALIRAAKAEGLPVTCDVAIHHAHLSEMDIGFFDANCHLIPPLRSQRDRDALREALADGTVDALCSDHAPVDDDAKLLPFAEAEPGATGLELLLPLTLKWANEMGISLSAAIAKISAEPSRILALNNGHLGAGQSADVCIFDPEKYWQVEPRSLKSQGRNTPFLGMELQGKVRYTLVEGHVVYEASA